MTKDFITGNHAAAFAAKEAGAEIMTGYPITPTTEIIKYWAELCTKDPKLKFFQSEDEMAAGFAMIGAILSGKKAFTATAGPGNVLMQDAFSMAENMRLPTVAFINQRGGPSTGTVIYSQQELNLTCFGGNGEGLRIVYSASNPQEMYDYGIKAFSVAWKYRFPAFVLSDGYSAKMQTDVELYKPFEKNIEEIAPKAFLLNPNKKEGAYANLRNTYNLESELNELLESHRRDFDQVAPEIVEFEDIHTLDAEIVVFAHGIEAQAAKEAVNSLRAEGKKIGLFRPITLSPFPRESLRAICANKKKFLSVESSLGQFTNLLKCNLYGIDVPMETLLRPALGINALDIIEKVNSILKG